MVDISDPKWSEVDSNNNGVAPDGIQGGYPPNTVAPILRATRGAVKRAYNKINAIYTTTGTATALVLTLAATPDALVKGERYAFFASQTNTGAMTLNVNGLGAKSILQQDGAALAAGQIVSGSAVAVIYDGTNFRLENYINNPKFTGTLTVDTVAATTINGNGATITGINASNIASGTVADARLPTTMTGKNFSSASYTSGLGNNGFFTTASSGSTFSIQRNNSNAVDIEAFSTTDPASKHSIDLNKYGGAVTINGNVAWHSGNDGAGSGLDADLLDGQQGSFYLNRTNHIGDVPQANVTGLASTLSSLTADTATKVSKSGGTLTGDVLFGPGTNGNYSKVQANGDVHLNRGDNTGYNTWNVNNAYFGWDGTRYVFGPAGSVALTGPELRMDYDGANASYYATGDVRFGGYMATEFGVGLSAALRSAKASLGVGQSWQNVLSNRSAGTVYQNTSGKTIIVAPQGWARYSFCEGQVSADNSTWLTPPRPEKIVNSDTTYYFAYPMFVVPANHYYRLTQGNNFLGTQAWLELR